MKGRINSSGGGQKWLEGPEAERRRKQQEPLIRLQLSINLSGPPQLLPFVPLFMEAGVISALLWPHQSLMRSAVTAALELNALPSSGAPLLPVPQESCPNAPIFTRTMMASPMSAFRRSPPAGGSPVRLSGERSHHGQVSLVTFIGNLSQRSSDWV